MLVFGFCAIVVIAPFHWIEMSRRFVSAVAKDIFLM